MHRPLYVLLRYHRRGRERLLPGSRRRRQNLNSCSDSRLGCPCPSEARPAPSQPLLTNHRQTAPAPSAPFLILIFRLPLTKFAAAPAARLTRPFGPRSLHESEVVRHPCPDIRRNFAARCFQLRRPADVAVGHHPAINGNFWSVE